MQSFLLLTSCDRMTVDCRYDCLPTYRALVSSMYFTSHSHFVFHPVFFGSDRNRQSKLSIIVMHWLLATAGIISSEEFCVPEELKNSNCTKHATKCELPADVRIVLPTMWTLSWTLLWAGNARYTNEHLGRCYIRSCKHYGWHWRKLHHYKTMSRFVLWSRTTVHSWNSVAGTAPFCKI